MAAGYREIVALGDLVAVAYAFSYEEGKVEAGEHDQDRFRPEWRTHEAARRIVQYINNFDEWQIPLGEMKQQRLGRELQPGEEPKCLIAPVASGMGVQGNNPFPVCWSITAKLCFLTRKSWHSIRRSASSQRYFFWPLKGSVITAISLRVMITRSMPRVSAIYLLYFLQNYVTDETMVRESI